MDQNTMESRMKYLRRLIEEKKGSECKKGARIRVSKDRDKFVRYYIPKNGDRAQWQIYSADQYGRDKRACARQL